MSWQAPTTNSNGSALTDLAGYMLNYGTSAAHLTESVKIDNPSTTSYTMQNLSSGTWYFAVSAYTSTGVQGALSDVVSATIH